MKEVFIAKNGCPYVKDESGKVRFISSAEWQEYQNNKEASNYGKYLFYTIMAVLFTVLVTNRVGEYL